MLNAKLWLQPPRGVTSPVGLLMWTVANCVVFASTYSHAWGSGFETPRSVEGTLAQTAERQQEGSLERYFEWKKQLEVNTGLEFGIDTQVQYLGANVSGDTTDAATNVFRFYGDMDGDGARLGEQQRSRISWQGSV